MQWGDVGTWVGALGTFSAVALALVVSVGDRRQRTAERRDEEKRHARMTFARLIGGSLLKVEFFNEGAMPVRKVRIADVRFQFPDLPAGTKYEWRLPTTMNGVQLQTLAPVAPGGNWHTYIEGIDETGKRLEIRRAEVLFDVLDAEGRWWRTSTIDSDPMRLIGGNAIAEARSRPRLERFRAILRRSPKSQ